MRPFSAEIRHECIVGKMWTLQIAVGDGRHYGSMTVEANADIDNGRLNLYRLKFEQLWKLALIYPGFCSGTHGMWREVRTTTCTDAHIRTRRAQIEVVERHFPNTEAHLVLEPLPSLGSEVHCGDRCPEQIGNHVGQVVEVLVQRRVENGVAVQDCETLGLGP